MSKAREIADLLDIGGDIVLGALDNLPTGAAPDWNTLLNKPTLAPSATTDTTNADNITSGTMLVGRIGTGANDTTTYLRGDGTWTTNCTNFSNCTNLTLNCDDCNGIITTASGSTACAFGTSGQGGIMSYTLKQTDSSTPADGVLNSIGACANQCYNACACNC